jgi:hypothetical protein
MAIKPRLGADAFAPTDIGPEPPDVGVLNPPPALAPPPLPAPPPRRRASASPERPSFTEEDLAALQPLVDEDQGGVAALQATKIPVTTRVTIAADRQMKILARRERTSQVDLFAEALNLLFEKRNMPKVG